MGYKTPVERFYEFVKKKPWIILPATFMAIIFLSRISFFLLDSTNGFVSGTGHFLMISTLIFAMFFLAALAKLLLESVGK